MSGPSHEIDPRIHQLSQPVVFFPVRHHSPACARLVEAAAARLQPKAILIEGPSDFNPSMAELARPHELPIAIYSYVRHGDRMRRGAFYPFCVYSPEWQAFQAGQRRGVPARFIDLPLADRALRTDLQHLYADTQERRGVWFESLAREIGVEGFDNLWDTLFEVGGGDDIGAYLERAHRLMYYARLTDSSLVTWSDQRREAFMAEQILHARREFGEPLLVVTGGFHSYALFARLHELPFEEPVPEPPADPLEPPVTDRGIALTPYSYQRLDALTGYNAGMPNPGFYHRVWEDRLTASNGTWRALLAKACHLLRAHKQLVSTADLIAVESMARGLANLRGHSVVWRQDLVDGVIAAAIKDDLAAGGRHPFLDAVHEALRGDLRGRLAKGTAMPPIAADIKRQIAEHGLDTAEEPRMLQLDLHEPEHLARVRVLHRLAILGISGFKKSPTGISNQGPREVWQVYWSPEFYANCIEAAIYGATLADGSRARLAELAQAMERSASGAAGLLLESCLMGHLDLAHEFHARLLQLLREDGDFLSVGAALGTLLHIYRYDDVLGSVGLAGMGEILAEAYGRALWLLEGCGEASGKEQSFIQAVRNLRDTVERCGASLGLERSEFVAVLRRTIAASKWFTLRGALTGALWSLSAATLEEVGADLPRTSHPQHLGDFLVGLFHVAREVVQRSSDLLGAIDRLLQEMDNDDFLVALPPLRLAFSVFTPREKDHLVATLFDTGMPVPEFAIPDGVAARHLAWEARLLDELARHGIRGGRRA
ncbi:MAG TPA: DUF5682 family protein [Bryobacteraceae bacterium]|nr:DUF5682 family protein [Bryobacteraceae bacterium]